MRLVHHRTVLIAMAIGAVTAPLIVLRDAIPSSETDWSGNWWVIAALTAAFVGAGIGALVGTVATALLARMRPSTRT